MSAHYVVLLFIVLTVLSVCVCFRTQWSWQLLRRDLSCLLSATCLLVLPDRCRHATQTEPCTSWNVARHYTVPSSLCASSTVCETDVCWLQSSGPHSVLQPNDFTVHSSHICDAKLLAAHQDFCKCLYVLHVVMEVRDLHNFPGHSSSYILYWKITATPENLPPTKPQNATEFPLTYDSKNKIRVYDTLFLLSCFRKVQQSLVMVLYFGRRWAVHLVTSLIMSCWLRWIK